MYADSQWAWRGRAPKGKVLLSAEYKSLDALVNMLCLFGRDVKVKNLNERTAMKRVTSNGHVAIVKLLRNDKASSLAEDRLMVKGSVMEEML